MSDKGFSGDLEFCSNFSFSVVRLPYRRGTAELPDVEHAYQAMKAGSLEEFLKQTGVCLYDYVCMTPGQAKRLGRKVRLVANWDEVKVEVMRHLLIQKFKIPELRLCLLATEGELVEWNHWHDNFWGVCTCNRCPGEGENMLGRLLMEIREVLL